MSRVLQPSAVQHVVTGRLDARVFPAVGVCPEVPDANRGVGHDPIAAAPASFAKGPVFGPVPRAVIVRTNGWLEKRDQRTIEPLVARRQLHSAEYIQVNSAPYQQKARPGVQDLDQAGAAGASNRAVSGSGDSASGPAAARWTSPEPSVILD